MTTEVRTGLIEREYGPFEGVKGVYGVASDGRRVWYAAGDSIRALDPQSGALVGSLDVLADAGTAFDGSHLYQLYQDEIRKIRLDTGEIVATLVCPCGDRGSGMAWAEGCLWIGEYRGAKIHRVDAVTGELLATLDSNRFVTGIAWANGELWHGSAQDDDVELRRIDAQTGEVRERVLLAEPGMLVAGVEAAGARRFYCGGGNDGKLRVVKCGESG